jgi:hypothetical protein
MALLAGCGTTSHLVTATRLEAAGDHKNALTEYIECAYDTHDLDCFIGAAELLWPEGRLADCKKFAALVRLTKSTHSDDTAFTGPHARERLKKELLKYPNIDSIEDWFSRADDVCRAKSEDAGDIRDDRQKRVLNNGCSVHRNDKIEALDPAASDEIARACTTFLDDFRDKLGIDHATDRAIADSVVLGALTALDDKFVAACRESALRPVCPSESELRKRMNARLLDLAQKGPPESRLRWARHFLKRWPDAPDAEKMRGFRERADLDLALAADPATRNEALDAFLANYPESPLRSEAEKARTK